MLSNNLCLPRSRPLRPLPPPQEEDEGQKLEEDEDRERDEYRRPLGQDFDGGIAFAVAAAELVAVAKVADDLAARGESAGDLLDDEVLGDDGVAGAAEDVHREKLATRDRVRHPAGRSTISI